MRYLPEQRLVVMDLVDLEHCGFDHESFASELWAAGLDDPAARWPTVLLVDFGGGHVVTPETKETTMAARSKAHASFEALLAQVLHSARPEESHNG